MNEPAPRPAMEALAQSLVGLRVSGVVALSPRSLAIAFGARPRRYLWIHLERKRADLTFADQIGRASCRERV